MLEKIKAFMGYGDEEDYEEYDEYYGEEDNRALQARPIQRETPVQEPKREIAHQVVVMKSNQFDDSSVVVDHLREGHTVVLNLQHTPVDLSRRMIDFISGAAYARDGHISQIAAGTFLIAPYNVDLEEEGKGRRYFYRPNDIKTPSSRRRHARLLFVLPWESGLLSPGTA